MSSKQISISLDEGLLAAIDQAAAGYHASRSWIVASLIRRGLRELGTEGAAAIAGGDLPIGPLLDASEAPAATEAVDAR